jgi:hypothetical protein
LHVVSSRHWHIGELSVFHNSWDRTYDLSGMDPGSASAEYDPYDVDIYRWMLQHRRKDRAHT